MEKHSYVRETWRKDGLFISRIVTCDRNEGFHPEWEGPNQDLKGKRILVIEGEGYGDQFYFLRWLTTLKGWGGKIDYVCNPSLAPLIEQMASVPWRTGVETLTSG